MTALDWDAIDETALLAGQPRLGRLERFGLSPLRAGLADARRSLVGTPYADRTELDWTSTRIFKPRITYATWRRRRRPDGKVTLYNFFNRNVRPKDAPYSVKVRECRDWRGGQFTYDGHLGTDFACPVGTPIASAAPGLVLRVACELDAGGLKVCVDHGDGLFTTHNHLARALVREGDVVRRGQVVGLSGVSGLEFVLCFPWVAPHLHYNTWLDGEPTDPFALPDEASLWRRRNDPVPFDGTAVGDDAHWAPSEWDADGVDAAIGACRDPEMRAAMAAFPTLGRRAAEVVVYRAYRPQLFTEFPPVYRAAHERRPVLDLPFRRADHTGVALPQEP